MKSLLHMHEVLDKEIANRKLESRFTVPGTFESDSKPGEVLFNSHDFEPLIALLGPQDHISEAVGEYSDRRDDIAKMCLAWISETRETARLARTDGTKRLVSVDQRDPDEVVTVKDVDEAENGPITFHDVEALEDEMEVYI